MGHPKRWFWRTALVMVMATVLVGVIPWIAQHTRSSFAPLTSPVHQRISTPSMAHAQAPPESTLNTFADPGEAYEIALLEGFQSHGIANGTVLESPDGSLAYSVVVVPSFASGSTLTDAALAQLARDAFQRGEGFIVKDFQSLSPTGIRLNWVGQVTTGGTQPLSGSIFARQFGDRVFLLMIAATDTASEELVGQAMEVLPSSLSPLDEPAG